MYNGAVPNDIIGYGKAKMCGFQQVDKSLMEELSGQNMLHAQQISAPNILNCY